MEYVSLRGLETRDRQCAISTMETYLLTYVCFPGQQGLSINEPTPHHENTPI